MKAIFQFVTSVLALGALLAGATSHATSIAELPLKASVLAKPNIVFGMDDSGSMDAEVMVDGTFQAWAYFSTSNATLYPSGALRTGSGADELPAFYLFPNGTGTGNRVYGDNNGWGVAAPPIPEVAWLRSADFNPLYYNSLKTYAPWAPGYVSAALRTYGDASPGAAKSHPALGTTTMALNANLTNSGTNWKFTFFPGMTIPAGATSISCASGSAGALPYLVATARLYCSAAVTYYPATFWKKETCTVNGTSCVTNYEGSTLKRYEIKAANTYPSGRSYTNEMQNFANWFTYYRKRRLMLAAAMGEVLENVTGLRMGVVAFNSRTAPTMYDADAVSPSANGQVVAGRFYTNEGSSATPTHATMAYIRGQFDTNTGIIQYACQRNAMFVITDGFANDSSVTPPTYAAATYGAAAPYTTTAAGSLADKALAYFTLRLRTTTSPLVAGKVPLGNQTVTNPDPNKDLHLNTYAVTLGMKGTLWPSATDPFVAAPAWPAPVSNTPSMIDDLWHATINGRGQMYLATDATNTAIAIQSGLNDILSANGAQGGVAVSTVNLPRGDSRAYFGRYNPAGWAGDLTANPVDATTGAISTTTVWSTSTLLNARDWNTRVIASYSGAAGVSFSEAAVGATVNPASAWGTTSEVMAYLRGDRTHEGTKFRRRTSLMGAVINSEPAVDRDLGVVYVASGEGMLHAVDSRGADAGKELWAFVPRDVLADVGQTSERGYAFKTKLDGSPVVRKIGTTKLLVAGMGVAGRTYYALDVTAPRGLDEAGLAAKVKWEFPAVGDATTLSKMGQALGRPAIVKVGANWVVLVTSGYNNTFDGKGRLWVLNANTGAVIKEYVTADGSLATEAGLTHLSPFSETNGTVRYVYAGDLLGNVLRFDLDLAPAAVGAVNKIAQLRGPTGAVQPVTTAPELIIHKGQRVVFVGTGRLLDIGDFGNTAVQTMYAITDGATLANARTTLLPQTYNVATDTVTGTLVNWTTQRGWYFDLPAGQQANTQPTIAYGALAFTANFNGGADCTARSHLYLVDTLSGQKVSEADFVSLTLSETSNSSAVTALRTIGGSAGDPPPPGGPPPPPDCNNRIVGAGQDSDGNPWKKKLICGAKILPAKNAWREVRR